MYIGRYPVISAVFFLARGLIDPRRIPFELTEIVAELFQIITSLICVVLQVGIRNQLYSFNVFFNVKWGSPLMSPEQYGFCSPGSMVYHRVFPMNTATNIGDKSIILWKNLQNIY